MMLPEEYQNKVTEYNNSLKFKELPLLSWDIHMQNLKKLTALHQDISYIKDLTDKVVTEVDILEELSHNDAVIVVTDTNLKIEFASNNMVKMSGYLPKEVIGKSPKVFQGPETDKVVSKKIRTLVDKQEKFEYVLRNYKKNNSVYDCHIKGYPVYDKKGMLIKYVAIEQVA